MSAYPVISFFSSMKLVLMRKKCGELQIIYNTSEELEIIIIILDWSIYIISMNFIQLRE